MGNYYGSIGGKPEKGMSQSWEWVCRVKGYLPMSFWIPSESAYHRRETRCWRCTYWSAYNLLNFYVDAWNLIFAPKSGGCILSISRLLPCNSVNKRVPLQKKTLWPTFGLNVVLCLLLSANPRISCKNRGVLLIETREFGAKIKWNVKRNEFTSGIFTFHALKFRCLFLGQ